MFFRARLLRLLWLLALVAWFSPSTRAQTINPHQIVQGFPATAAGINSEDTYLGANPGIINVITPGSYCDTTVLLSANHQLQLGQGTYVMNIAGADSAVANVTWSVSGKGPNQTILQSCPSSNLDVITSQNFGTFTGGSSNYGVFRPVIKDLKIDGNLSNESGGYGIRLYTKAPFISNIIVTNCYNDCIWGEYGGSTSEATEQTDIEGIIANTKIINANGNGITNKGAFRLINGIDIFLTTGWGIDTYSAIEDVTGCNIFTGGTSAGGVKTETGGAIVKLDGEIAGGKWGVYVGASSAGPMVISGALAASNSISGSVGLEIHSSNVTFEGTILNAKTGVLFSAAGAFNHIRGYLLSNTTGIDTTATGGFNDISVTMVIPALGADWVGTWSPSDEVFINASGGAGGTNHGVTRVWAISAATIVNGPNGVSAGTVTLSTGAGSHNFTYPYNVAPYCTATDGTTASNPVKVTANTTTVTLAGTGSDVVTWICTPGAN